MTVSFALTTKERVKTRLGIVATTFDTLIDRLITSVTARIETMCGRHFQVATYTHEIYDGSDSYGQPISKLILKNAPVASIASIQYKTGLNSNPSWVTISENEYDINLNNGILEFYGRIPVGRQNIRVSYTAGFSLSSIGIDQVWVFDYIDAAWVINGSNRTFALPEAASDVVVYADGIRVLPANYTFSDGDDEVILDAGQEPFTAVSIDYKPSNTSNYDVSDLPLEIVEVCEEIVVAIFKKRESEGRQSESFGESSITWNAKTISDEQLATIKNYRRVCL